MCLHDRETMRSSGLSSAYTGRIQFCVKIDEYNITIVLEDKTEYQDRYLAHSDTKKVIIMDSMMQTTVLWMVDNV